VGNSAYSSQSDRFQNDRKGIDFGSATGTSHFEESRVARFDLCIHFLQKRHTVAWLPGQPPWAARRRHIFAPQISNPTDRISSMALLLRTTPGRIT